MFVGLKVTEFPGVQPIDIPTVQQHCRVDQTTDNNLLTAYLATAIEQAEGYLGRALITQTIQQTMGPESAVSPNRHWQRGRGPFTLLRAPVQSISSVTVLDMRGNQTTIAPGNYTTCPVVRGYQADLNIEPVRVWIDPELVLTQSAPGIGGGMFRDTPIQNVQITYVAGYGTAGADVPNSIINGLLLQVANLYEHRGDDDGEMSPTVERLLNRYRLHFFGD